MTAHGEMNLEDSPDIRKNLNESDSMSGTTLPTRTLADLPGPKAMQLFGNIFQIEPDRFHHTLENWAHEFGPFYRIKIGHKPLLIVADSTIVVAVRAFAQAAF